MCVCIQIVHIFRSVCIHIVHVFIYSLEASPKVADVCLYTNSTHIQMGLYTNSTGIDIFS